LAGVLILGAIVFAAVSALSTDAEGDDSASATVASQHRRKASAGALIWRGVTLYVAAFAAAAAGAALMFGGDPTMLGLLAGLALGGIGIALTTLSFASSARAEEQLDRIEAAIRATNDR
jgi:hypothetical protein